MYRFQAAWDGDIETIKELTLAPWGPTSENTPLKIAVEDRDDQSPFSIAVLRGHLNVARAIVQISFAQYHPETKEEKARYRMGDDVDEYDEDSIDDNGSDDVPVYKEIIDDRFTIDNIGEVSTQVKSKTSPVTFISWSCSAWKYKKFFGSDTKFTYGVDNRTVSGGGRLSLTSWSIKTNNMRLFSFLLDLEIEWLDRLADKSDGSSAMLSFSDYDFKLAINYGRLDMLAEMIKHGGAGMDLESLVKTSGVKYHEKPKYYQGLSVHGRKREDWVSAARGTRLHNVSDMNPPLLEAAFKGSLASVEWFLSDAPARHYTDFSEAYKQHKLIRHLNTAAGGFEKVLPKWLGARRKFPLFAPFEVSMTNLNRRACAPLCYSGKTALRDYEVDRVSFESHAGFT